jgi:hypothetical protein
MIKSAIAKLVEEVLREFNKKAVNYAVLRNYENSFYDTQKDIDLLIEPKYEKRAIAIIQRLSKDYVRISYITKNQQRTTINLILNDNTVFSFDLNHYVTLNLSNFHKRFIGFGLKITINDLDTIRISPNNSTLSIVIVSPVQEAILLLNHTLTKKKTKYLNKINAFLKNNNFEPLKSNANSEEILYKINELFPASKIRRHSFGFLRNILSAINYLLFKLFAYRKSRVIYFSGPDGSGKSTSYLNTIELLQKLRIKYFPLRGLQIGMQYYIFSRKRRKQANQQGNVLSNVGRLGYSDLKRDRDTGKLSWKFRRIIGLSVGLIDINILGRLFVFLKRLQGNTIIVEESPVDIFVKRHRPQIKSLEKLFVPLLPSANLSILCRASEEAIFKRKPELNKTEIIEYYDRISELFNRNNRLNKIDLPTDINIQESNLILINTLGKILN